jgi:sugar/nucleoside kinase (ribokinase family)
MTRGIFVGLSTIDLIHTVDEFPPADTKAVAHGQKLLVGGPATNAAITFSHFGGDAKLVAAVGHHALASVIREELQHYAVGLIDLTPDSDNPPPVSSVWVNRRGQRSIVSVNMTRFNIPPSHVDRSILEGASILLVDGHSMAACYAWAEAAVSAQVSVVFDGGSWKPGTDKLLQFVDTAICSADFRPPGCTSEDEAIQYLRETGVRQIAITSGAESVRFITGTSAGSVEVPQVDAVDTSGAGDIFHGAFCFYTASGSSFVDALRESAKVASEACRYHGTREWMLTR